MPTAFFLILSPWEGDSSWLSSILRLDLNQLTNDMKWKERKWNRSVVSNFLWPHGLEPARLLYPWDFPGKNTGMDCHFLLQGIFPTQGLNLVSCIAGGFFTTDPPGKPFQFLAFTKKAAITFNTSLCMNIYFHLFGGKYLEMEWLVHMVSPRKGGFGF